MTLFQKSELKSQVEKLRFWEEIEVLKHVFLKTAITLKLGFENLYCKETPRIYIKNLPVKED